MIRLGLLEAREEGSEACTRRLKAIPWIDPIDLALSPLGPLRSRRPGGVFCLMDVSGSMNEHMKDLASVLSTLLYLFL